MTSIEPSADAPKAPSTAPRRRTSRQVVAGVCGTILLIVAGVITLGGAVIAVIGIVVAALIARKRSRTLSKPLSWLAAGLSVQLVLLAISGYGMLKAPGGMMTTIQHAMDSSRANPPPPPAWLDRIAPRASARARAARTSPSPAFNSPSFAATALVVTSIFGAGILGAIIGTVGWLVAFPLAYAVTGRWLGEGRAA
jgi:hypothetical protein